MSRSWEIVEAQYAQTVRVLFTTLVKNAAATASTVSVTASAAPGRARVVVTAEQDAAMLAAAMDLTGLRLVECEPADDALFDRQELARTIAPLPLGGLHGNGAASLLTPGSLTTVANWPHYLRGSLVPMIGGGSVAGKAASVVATVASGIGISMMEPRVWAPIAPPHTARLAVTTGRTLERVRQSGFVTIVARGYEPDDADAKYAGVVFELAMRSHPDLVNDREQLQVVRRLKQRQPLLLLGVSTTPSDLIAAAFRGDTSHYWTSRTSPLDIELAACEREDERAVVDNYKHYATDDEAITLINQVFAPVAAPAAAAGARSQVAVPA